MKTVKRPEKPEYECIGDIEELASFDAWYNACYDRDKYIKKLERYTRYLEKQIKAYKEEEFKCSHTYS